ncbi:MAG TPA: T9SS type B sorting domain-containing protein [Luteibaculaceae bacterium]|nr:T9SS type B sorting domain-containing protein [Luteibaculaceae bacterium]
MKNHARTSLLLSAATSLTLSTAGLLAQSPGGIGTGNLTLWLKADGTSTTNHSVFSTAGTANRCADGTGVYHWDNLNPGGTRIPSLDQTAAGQQPRFYQNNGAFLINFNPAIYFDGGNDVLRSLAVQGTSIFNNNQNTIFQVINYRGPDNTGVWFKWEDTNTEGNRIGFESTGASSDFARFDIFNGTNCTATGPCNDRQNRSATRAIDDRYRVLTAHHNNLQSITLVDGFLERTANFSGSNNINLGATQPLQIGANSTLGAGDFWTEIGFAEVLVYNTRLNSASIDRVESYLAIKYGITLGHDYVLNSNTVWSLSLNPAYNSGIIGLARDEASNLYQRQSKSMSRLVDSNPERDLITISLGVAAVNNQSNTGIIPTISSFMSGTNGARPLALQTTENPAGVRQTLNREWLTQQAGFQNQDITISFDLSAYSSLVNGITCGELAFIMDDDGNFSNGTVLSAAQSNLTINGLIYTVRIPSNQFLTLPYYTLGVVNISGEVMASASDVTCPDVKNGTITVPVPANATTPLTYSIDGGSNFQNSGSFSNLDTGEYYIEVRDANNCIFRDTVDIIQPTKLVLDTNVFPTACPQVKTGRIDVLASGGTPGYQFSQGSGPMSGGSSFTNLGAGTYRIYIQDANGCKDSIDVPVTANPEPTVIAPPDTLICAGERVRLFGSGTPGLSFSWTGGITNNAFFTPSSTAQYKVTGTLPNGCRNTDSTIVTVAPLPNAGILPPPSIICSDTSTIQLAAQTAGGNWSGPGISNPFTGTFEPALSGPGTFTITHTVTDANGCRNSATVNITITPRRNADINPAGPFCTNAGLQQMTAVQSGGTWSGNHISTSGVFNPQQAGNGSHIITYTLGGTCPQTQSETILVNTTFDATILPGGPYCVTDSPVALQSVTPGASWSGPGITDANSGIFSPSAAGVGSHTITHSIAGSCGTTDTEIFVVLPLDTARIIAPNDSLCFEGTPMQLMATQTGGTWLGSADANGIFDPLGKAPGLYSIFYTYGNQCPFTDSTQLRITTPVQSSMANTQVPCFGDVTGVLSVNTTGGSGSYQYQWTDDTTASSPNRSGLAAGNYQVFITDQLGCMDSAFAQVSQPTQVVIVSKILVNDSCFQSGRGLLQAIVSGGSPGPGGYLFQIQPNVGNLLSTGNGYAGLRAGNYRLTATDQNGCAVSWDTTVTEPPLLQVAADGQPDYCNQSIGKARIASIVGGTSPYYWIWNTGATSDSISGRPAGVDTLFVTDRLGCRAQDTARITLVAGPGLSISTVPCVCFGDANGQATATATGGTGILSLVWSDGQGNNQWMRTNYPQGTYSATVTDQMGCSQTTNFTITQPTQVLINPVNDYQRCYTTNYSGVFSAFGGNGAPYSFRLNNAPSPANFTISAAGLYSVSANDSRGCPSDTAYFNVTDAPSITSQISPTDTVCRGDTAQFTLSAQGGNGNYQFFWMGENQSSNRTRNFPTQVTTPTINPVFAIVSDGCAKPDTLRSQFVLRPDPAATIDIAPREGCIPLQVQFVVQGNLTNWQLNTNFGGIINRTDTAYFTYTQPGTYYPVLSGQTTHGCALSFTIDTPIVAYGYPEAKLSYQPQQPTVINNQVQFSDVSLGGSASQWLIVNANGDTLFTTNANRFPFVLPPVEGLYSVRLISTSAQNCADTTSALIRVKNEIIVHIPNAFTPNGDGVNDLFGAVFSSDDVDFFEMLIFDRWGELVWRGGLFEFWDGTYKGEKCKTDLFNYRARYKFTGQTEIVEVFGHVNLLK